MPLTILEEGRMIYPGTVTIVTGKALNVTYQNGSRPRQVSTNIQCYVKNANDQAYATGQIGAAGIDTDVMYVGTRLGAGACEKTEFLGIAFFVPEYYYYRISTATVGLGLCTKISPWVETDL